MREVDGRLSRNAARAVDGERTREKQVREAEEFRQYPKGRGSVFGHTASKMPKYAIGD
ncbi:hypothetical protein [Streptomyces sp. NPDC050121]|uniref:hypothetical protein n=1 Tax=Streptomyces sp. NPDC050121 TaxID=3365601 RepID=UPI0037AA4C53